MGESRSTHTKRKTSNSWQRSIKRWFSFLSGVLIIGTAVLIISLLYLRAQALPAANVMQTSQLLDINGQVIDSFHAGQNRQVIPIRHISPYIIKATIAIEDRRFYSHFGVDLQGLARAVLTNIQHMSKVQGASTITQQLARNLYLNHDRNLTRKIKEALYAIQLEMKYSKDEILEKYLNQIYFGHSTYGVQAASQMFFHKNAKDLTLAESALLVGVPKGPKYYSPYLNLENARSRQKIILQTMADQEIITQEEADRAAEEILVIMPREKEKHEAPYFYDYIRYTELEQLGISEEHLHRGGIRIYTTLDLRAQQIAEEVVLKHLGQAGELQGALVAMDPRNGHIKAMVGGKNYEDNQFNRVFSTSRQPGSAFKPIVYLTALSQNDFTAATQFKSEPTLFSYDNGRGTYMPSNFGNKYAGELIDLRTAIAHSDNIFAVHSIMKAGPENVIEMARKLGIRSSMMPLPSLALGTYPISPFEMASAFGTIANLGERVEPTSILRIENNNGTVLYEAKPSATKVIEPAYAYVLTSLMESVFDETGTAHRVAKTLKRPVAGKTGTTNTDAWMVGYTPELVAAVWIGYDRDRSISAVESYKAAPVFAEFTERTLEPVPPKIFQIPSGVVTAYIDPQTGGLATTDCPDARLEPFVKGTEPHEFCTLHGTPPNQEAEKPDDDKNRGWWEDLKRWWND